MGVDDTIIDCILTITCKFMNTLLPIHEMPYLVAANITIWMMSCGALVKNSQSYTDLRVATER
jgi:hypothetical protein